MDLFRWSHRGLMAAVALVPGLLLGCAATGDPAPLPVTMVPVPSMEDRAAAAGWLDGGDWHGQHEDILRQLGVRRPRAVFIGDSITQSWGGDGRHVSDPGRPAWNREFGTLSALNAGISGDRTQHVLWRLDHGLLEGPPADVYVVMIGTNNLPDDPPGLIAEGVKEIVRRLLELHPEPAVLLLGVPPRGRSEGSDLREKTRVCNLLLKSFAQSERIEYFDPAEVLTRGGGDADSSLMAADFIHLTPAGYDALAKQIAPRVRALLDPNRPRRP